MSDGRATEFGVALPPRSGAASVWQTARGPLPLDRPLVMGILNVTPDSFSDGGRFQSTDSAVARAEELARDGADILDIGGESTRPGAEPVPADEEKRRTLPVIEAVARRIDVPVSIDTTKSTVARAALDAGAAIVNDISGLRFDPDLATLAAERDAGLVLMHIRGEPRTMQKEIHYDDLLGEVVTELGESVGRATGAGCERSQLVIDPGIGFGKTAEHSLRLLNRLDRLTGLGLPILVGPSRKSFIGKALDLPVQDRLEATLAACVVALVRGARIFRVHDARPARRALDLAHAILTS